MKRIILVILLIASSLNTKAVDYYCKSTGGFNTLGTWGTNTDGTGTAPTTFANAADVWHFSNRTSALLTLGFSPPNTAKVVIESGFNLSISGFAGSLNETVDISSGGTLTLLNSNNGIPLNFGTLDVNSTMVYSTTAAVVQIPNENFGNLVIAESISCGTNLNSFYIYGLLTINATKTLTLNGSILRSESTTGSFAGSGFIRGSASSGVQVGGGNGGNNGTINFAGNGGNVLEHFFVTFVTSASDRVLLGTDLEIAPPGNWVTGVFYHSFGSFDLNGHMLTIQPGADLTLPLASGDGFLLGNSTSSLVVDGSVNIYAAGSNVLYMDPSNNTLGLLRLNSATTMDIGNALNINNTLDITGGATLNTNNNVTLVSTSTLKGRLADISNGTLTGDLSVQTFARGGITDWVNIGVSGVTGETINSGWYGQIPMAIEGSATGVTSANSQYFESVQKWDESVSYYDTLVTVTDALVPGEGYWLFLGDALTTTNDMVWTVTGPAVTGPQVINLTNSGVTSAASGPGFNLIANPFPSPIDWNSVVTNNPLATINDAYYIYDPDLGNTVSFINGIATPGSGTLTNYQTMADIIPMGQAFYVEATANTSLTFDEIDKSASNGSNFQLLKSSNQNSSNSSIGSPIRLNIDGGGYHDDAVIRFHSNATTSFDKSLDAHKMYSSPGYVGYPGQWTARTAISTRMNNEDFSVNSIPYAHTQNAVIPVVARVYTSGQHTISASELQNLPPGTCVDLKDLYDNSVHDLTAGNYVVTLSDTTFYPRFELTICANITADVKTTQIQTDNSVRISKDANGVFVKFDESSPVDATIYATNILGQTIMDAKNVKATNDTFYLDIKTSDQLIFVTVVKGNERTTQKILNIK